MQLWGLASLKSVEQARRLETYSGFLCHSLEAEFFLLQTNKQTSKQANKKTFSFCPQGLALIAQGPPWLPIEGNLL